MALDAEKRSEVDATIAGLVGRRIDSIAYWGLSPFDDCVLEPWDYGMWHHAIRFAQTILGAGDAEPCASGE